jgi:Tfp pilus assembly protein FimV
MAATFHPSDEFVRAPGLNGAVEVPNYLLRRFIAALVALCLLAAAVVAVGEIVGALSDLGGRPAAASEITPDARTTPTVHVAAPGDTLWSIADRYRGDVGRDRYLDALIALNGGSSALVVGQGVRLP